MDGSAPAPLDSPAYYRTVWISDIHLGTRGCKAEVLLDFLLGDARRRFRRVPALPEHRDALRRYRLRRDHDAQHGFNTLRRRLGLPYWSLKAFLKTRIRTMGDITYCNDGDWVDNCTALVEHPDGRLEIVDWLETIAARAAQARVPEFATAS